MPLEIGLWRVDAGAPATASQPSTLTLSDTHTCGHRGARKCAAVPILGAQRERPEVGRCRRTR
jgi:hypothetical protein